MQIYRIFNLLFKILENKAQEKAFNKILRAKAKELKKKDNPNL